MIYKEFNDILHLRNRKVEEMNKKITIFVLISLLIFTGCGCRKKQDNNENNTPKVNEEILKEKQVKKIILTRPAVEAGENLGFLPGDMKEKLDPYMQPLYDALRDMLPNEKLEDYITKGIIQIAPLAFMRGRTLDHAFVILDEAQNTTHSQMKMFLTRMGKCAKFMITGDPGQVDLPRRTISGLKEALLVLKDIEGIGIIYLDDKDIVRHRLVKKVIDAYKQIENNDY